MTNCPTCGEDGFSSRKYMRSHHKQAHGESIAGFEYTCHWCDKSGVKSQINDRDEHQFCSTECYHNWRAETLVGEDSPAWEGRTVMKKCDNCGEETVKNMVNVEKRNNVFCSQACHSEFMSGTYDGPSFARKSYGPNWEEKRAERLDKDDHKCVVCSMSNEEHKHAYGCSLHVHHVTPIRKFADDGELDYERANRLSNLITLCGACHGRWEGIPLRPEGDR